MPKKEGAADRLRKYFIAGLIVLLPLTITVYVISMIFRLMDGLLASYVEAFLGFPLPGLGMLITIVFILLVGMIAANVLGRKLIALFDRMIACIPMVKTLYVATKQIVDAFAVQPKEAFRRVALLEYPRRGVYSIGFVTSEGLGEVQEKTAANVTCIFIPTTPNPTSGVLLLVPEEEITFLDMSVEDGLKLIISGGLAAPQRQ